VKVLVGDWTNGDPAITRFLESRGRAAVPLYLWYPPGSATPEELPQVLTAGLLSARARALPPR
jgi:thiol:disulfide interchange protein